MDYPFKDETHQIIGICMEVQNNLGFGFSEVIYKDAMEIEFMNTAIPYLREFPLHVVYKGKELKRKFCVDFICFENIILEAKSSEKGIANDHISQVLNYLKASGKTLALIINFGKRRLEFKRLIFSQSRM